MDTQKVLLEHQKLIIIIKLIDTIFYRFFPSRPVERSCILSHSRCMPLGGGWGGGGGGSLICSYIRRLRPFLGFKILNFNIFGVFFKK